MRLGTCAHANPAHMQDGGLADDETLEASWDEEAWDDPGA